jgi:short chain dehydrogenase
MKTPALFDLTGRVAIVTGGNGGIGRGIALGLAETGAAVAIFGRNEEKNRHVLAELKTIGVPSIAVKVDLTDRAALEPAFKRVESELGDVSILVNNAGNVSLSGGVLNEKPEDLGQRHRDPTQRSLPSLQARRPVDAPSARWKDYQHREHVLLLRLWAYSLVQRGERSDCATDQVDGHRTRPAQYTSECDRPGVDRNGHDSSRA